MDKNEKTVETTVFDYLRWRGDLTFAQDSFNEVDNLVLCIIAYLNFRRFPELKSREADKAVPLGDVVARIARLLHGAQELGGDVVAHGLGPVHHHGLALLGHAQQGARLQPQLHAAIGPCLQRGQADVAAEVGQRLLQMRHGQ